KSFGGGGQIAIAEKQIRRSEVERDVVLFGEFLELFLRGLKVFFASRPFSQSDNGIAIVRDLREHIEGFFFSVGELSRAHITTGKPYPILSVARIEHARSAQKCAGAHGCSFLQPHCSDSFDCASACRYHA